MRSARFRLASLWLSQAARNLADNALRMVVVLHVARSGSDPTAASWQQVALFFILPFFLLAPLNGPLCNSLPKGRVLIGSSVFSLVAMALTTALAEGPLAWCAGLTLAMLGAAVYSPTRYALLPAAAADTHIPLSRINGWIEMGSAAAVVGGLLLGVSLYGTEPGRGVLVAVLLGLNAVALLAALPVHFPSDVRRPEAVGPAVRGFFRDGRRVLGNREAAACLFGLAAFLAVVLGGTGVLLDHTGALMPESAPDLRLALFWISAGAAVGSLTASLQGHPRRTLGLVTPGLLGVLLALVWAGLSRDLVGPTFWLGFMAGLVNVPLRATYQTAVPADARGNAMAVSNCVNYLGQILLAALLVGLGRSGLLGSSGQLTLLIVLAALGCALAARWLFQDTFEQFLELVFWPIYRIYGYGPGLDRVPPQGPVLIVANHTAWFDPLWAAKVIRRRLYPMMTSDFYDLPVAHFFFAHVFHAVRVQASAFRREAPELKNAVAVLDRGDCLSIFPEGWLRRSPEPSVRQFGQGVWHILRERPNTPVVLCWIEGGWGSYTSYFKGKPTVNKPPDFWRRIDIAVSEPIVVPEEILTDLRTTRVFLMRKCLEARAYLGLEVPKLPELEEEEKEDRPAGKSESA